MEDKKEDKKILLQHDTPILSWEDYLAVGGGQALKKALEMPQTEVIDMVKRSGLRGRGGAGFPTGRKWEGIYRLQNDVIGQPAIKYVLNNFAEGEPGTYKDRYIVQWNPYQVVEGTAIAVYAIGAACGYICSKAAFVRENPLVEKAIEEFYAAGYLGEDVLGSGKNIDIKYVKGPDDYLYGEAMAMMEVVEGKPAWPKAKGIGARLCGLYGNPTIVNNLETLSNIPHIIKNGPEWFRSFGTESSPGTMVFTLIGDVVKEGMYELPLGISLRSLIYDYGGGPPLGRRVKAVFSGVSSSVITREHLDTALDFDELAKISGLGSAGFIVYDDTACMIKAALNFSKFLAVDSCGQCISCKAGCGRITRWLEMLEEGTATEQTVLDILKDCEHIKGQGHCFVVSQESIVISSIIHHFPEEVVDHIEYGCMSDRHIPLAKIKGFDAENHTFIYDEAYFEKAALEGREVFYP